jgi:hypothetical protein
VQGPAAASEVPPFVRDPYLADALEEYDRVLADLTGREAVEHVEENIYLLCELSRDVTIRLWRFSQEMAPTITQAKARFAETLEVLKSKPTNPSIAKYAGNIQKRIDEYEAFIARG